MTNCKPINGLTLDFKSKKLLQRIKKKGNLQKALATALATGVVSNIFTKNKLPLAALNIKNTERAIRTDIESIIFDYELDYNPKLLAFWKGVLNGCK